jgi:hypothetical protein
MATIPQDRLPEARMMMDVPARTANSLPGSNFGRIDSLASIDMMAASRVMTGVETAPRNGEGAAC